MRFDTVLIANRGAIARRIARTCRELGLKTIQVYSSDDCHPELLTLADQVLEIPCRDGVSGYRQLRALIAAARAAGAAIHPGYGFLAEDPELARACQAAGLVWIGPSPAVLALSGDKSACVAALRAAGLPLLPSHACQRADAETLTALQQLGLPLLLKPSHGGGGLGMVLVEHAEHLAAALSHCLAQAQQLFGAASVLAERWLPQARHLEVQVLADQYGQRLTLPERDCSLQRRRQKVIEESPAPRLSPELRAHLHRQAEQAAAVLGLDQVATVEFLWDGAQSWLLEINPRLQVEHALSEALSGLDLVEWQLRIAAGESLNTLPPVSISGHAFEARVYAEQPWSGLPAPGQIDHLRLPDGHGLRLEVGAYAGMRVSGAYDPLLLKIIAHGPTRARALARLQAALQTLELCGSAGFASNQALLCQALQAPEVVAGGYHTRSLEDIGPPGPENDASLAPLLAQLARPERQPTLPNKGFWRPAWQHP